MSVVGRNDILVYIMRLQYIFVCSYILTSRLWWLITRQGRRFLFLCPSLHDYHGAFYILFVSCSQTGPASPKLNCEAGIQMLFMYSILLLSLSLW